MIVVAALGRLRSAIFATEWKPAASSFRVSGGDDSVADTPPLSRAAVAFAVEPVENTATSTSGMRPSFGSMVRIPMSNVPPTPAMATFLPLRSAGVLMSALAYSWYGHTGPVFATTTTSPPPAVVVSASEPPMWAICVCPASSAGSPVVLAMSWRSTSRKFWSKMPASFATYAGK